MSTSNDYSATCATCDRAFLLPNVSLPVHYLETPTMQPTTPTCGTCGCGLSSVSLAGAGTERILCTACTTRRVEPNALVSGAQGAVSYAELAPGTVVRDECGHLYGIVEGPYLSPVRANRAFDAACLLVIVRTFPEAHATHPGSLMAISGRYLEPARHGPAEEASGRSGAWAAWQTPEVQAAAASLLRGVAIAIDFKARRAAAAVEALEEDAVDPAIAAALDEPDIAGMPSVDDPSPTPEQEALRVRADARLEAALDRQQDAVSDAHRSLDEAGQWLDVWALEEAEAAAHRALAAIQRIRRADADATWARKEAATVTA